MTSFLYARDTFKQEVFSETPDIALKLMFDEHNPTVEDEIVTQSLSEVIVRGANKAEK